MKTHITNEKFVEILSAARSISKLTNREIADELHLSVTTVSRWLIGKNLPVQSMRPAIVKYLERRISNL